MAMKSFNSLFAIMAILASLTLLIKTSHSSPVEVNYAPGPLSAYGKYLSNCASKLKPICGQEIFSGVFVGSHAVSDNCCHSLVNDMGKSCHVDLTKYGASSPTFKKNATEIMERCYKVWDYCSLVHLH
ncbi:protein DOWN-REGULATED IN DIF1 11-like [Lotus japonicus]|uniref:protein DOWN-REGULATED IN DIF1 11-like n=1 Tax=Lotus japonicus TaxID=34305 RepID=UPI0025831EC5|nr:protein DOWN-REGULATED IN DIF1 11-like [Lotus japonicus]